jgi:hypothetical protein
MMAHKLAQKPCNLLAVIVRIVAISDLERVSSLRTQSGQSAKFESNPAGGRRSPSTEFAYTGKLHQCR